MKISAASVHNPVSYSHYILDELFAAVLMSCNATVMLGGKHGGV